MHFFFLEFRELLLQMFQKSSENWLRNTESTFEVFRAVETIGYPECQINLAHGTVYLAMAAKDRGACDGFFEALRDVEHFGNLEIPLNLRNAPTKLMKDIGYGKGYEMYTTDSLLPEKLKGRTYYKRAKARE